MNPINFERRRLLKVGLMCTAAVLLPPPVLTAAAFLQAPERKLSFYNMHTGENLNVTYFERNRYRSDALNDINHILRDHRTDQIQAIDTRLLDLLFAISRRVQTPSPIHVISGYRSPESNARLRARDLGVARKSMHMRGKAVDIRWPGCDLNQLRRIAVDLRGGGVGYYPSSDFVHVDTGAVRYW